jgi:hypothetical protein
MTIKSYISETIDNHENKWRLFFNSEMCNAIHDGVINKGIYAFQIIYSVVDAFDNSVEEIKPLDHKLCIHEDILGSPGRVGNMWSYDGGQRYQWSEMETLVFDSSLIRNIKLNKLLNEL